MVFPVRDTGIYVLLDSDLRFLNFSPPSLSSEDSEEKDVKTKKDDSHSAGSKQFLI